ncbi:hypothetical protein NW837_10185 [Synechococcus sp. R6-10]|uniref:hypothetical protein n=1 Tax=Synechococcus sp. R6-10 TaxID=2291956 RepID=UPI0039C40256
MSQEVAETVVRRRRVNPFVALRRAQELAEKAKAQREEAARRLAEAEAEIQRFRRVERSRARAALGGAVIARWASLIVKDGKEPEALMSSIADALSDADRKRVLEHLIDEVASLRRRQARSISVPSP